MPGEIDTTQVITELLPALHADSLGTLYFWTEAELLQWLDEALKKLARKTMIFVERSIATATAADTATYPLPPRHLATLHVTYDSSSLQPATQVELEARDEEYATTPGAPDHWYEDKLGLATIGVTPVPEEEKPLPIIYSVFPPTLDASQFSTLFVQAPAPLKGYLAMAALAKAYGREGESEMPDLAQHCAARLQLYEAICEQYYGKNSAV